MIGIARLVLCLAVVLAHAPVSAQSRHALVVGIDNYHHVGRLAKAVNDAVAVAGALGSAGFDTELLTDVDEAELLTELARFAGELDPGDEVVFYFAGHGVEIAGQNYLLPADVPLVGPGSELVVTRASLPVHDIIDQFNMRGARLSLLILDACRDNPFAVEGTRSVGRARGLGSESPPEGTFVMFSAGAGQQALDALSRDDPNPNSVFTRVLLPRLTEPGLPLRTMVREVRSEVRRLGQTINHEQFPAVYDQLDGAFTFVPGDPVASNPAPGGTASADPCDAARRDWDLVAGQNSAAVLRAFRDTYSACPLMVAIADERLAALDNARPEPCEAARTDWVTIARSSDSATLEAFRATHADCPVYVALAEERLRTLVPEPPAPVAHLSRTIAARESCVDVLQPSIAPGTGRLCASSVLAPQSGNTYVPGNLFDGNPNTGWVEGVTGRGEGETLAFDFDRPTDISAIRMVNGYTKSTRLYWRNARVREMRVTGSTGASATFFIEDTPAWQELALDGMEGVMWLQLEILSTYPGSAHADTVISEMRLE